MKRLLGKSCLILVLLSLSVSVAWGGNHGAHSLTIEVTATGEGKVYLSTSAAAPSDNSVYGAEKKEIVINCGGSNEKSMQDCNHSTNKAGSRYAFAKLNKDYGYYFAGWYQGNTLKSSDIPYNITWSKQAKEENKVDTYEARFSPVSPTGATGDLTIVPQSLTGVESHTVVFTTEGRNNLNDFEIALITGTLGDGNWSVDWSKAAIADNKVTVTYTYQANRTTYKNSAGTRTDEARLTLTSKAGESYSVTIKATFPTAQVTGVSQDVTATPTSIPFTTSGTITYNVAYVDDVTDFTCNKNTTDGDGSWVFGNPVLSDDKQKVSVAYTYNTGRSTYTNRSGNRTDKAAVTLTSLTDAASTKTCNLQVAYPEAVIGAPTAVNNIILATPELSKTATVVFPVQYVDDAKSLSTTIVSKTGTGTWQIVSCNYADGNATVTYSYKVDETNYTYNNTATLTLSTTRTDGTTVSQSADVAATCALSIYAADRGEYLTFLPTDTEGKSSVATFSTAYANAGTTFTATFANQSGGGTWTKEAPQYSASATAPYGTVSVPFGFTPPANTPGDYSTDLILSSGTESFTVTLQATVEALSEYDAEVITPDGTVIPNLSWAEALAEANKEDNRTLRLLRNVDLETLAVNQEIKKTMTIDLNGKTLSATLTSTYCRLLYLNTAGITLTVTDSRSGGAIKATGALNINGFYAIQVAKGNLILDKGRIEVENTTTYNNDWRYAVAVYQANNTVFTMNGGELVATKPTNRNAYGVYAEAGSTTDINGGVITATAGSYAYGVRSYGNVTMTAGTINATTTATSYAYGIYMGASANADVAKCSYGALNMTGGFVNALTAEGTACGVYLYATSSGLTDNAPDGTYTNKASAVGVLKNAVITAHSHTIASGIASYGVWCVGSYNSKDGKNVSTLLENCTIEALITDVSASNNTTSSAYGIYVAASVSEVLGAKLEGNVALTNCNVTAKSEGYRPKGTYNGVTYANGTHGNAYGLYVATAFNVIKNTGSPIEHVGEMYAAAAKAVVNGGTYTAVANKNTAYAVYSAVRAVTYDGQTAYPELYLNGGTYYAETLTGTTAYALNSGGNTVVDGGEFTALAGTTTAAGFYVNAGKLTATGSVVSATGKTGTAYGVCLMRGFNDVSAKGYDAEVVLNNLDVTVSTTEGNTANGIYVYAGEAKTYTDATFKTWATNSVKVIDGNGNPIGTTDAQKAVNTKLYEVYNRCYQRGEFVNIPKSVTVNGGTYRVTAAGTGAYGINMPNTGVSATGQKQASVPLTATNAKFTAKTNSGSTAYGIQTGGPTVIDRCDITATAAGSTVRGVILYDKEVSIANSRIIAEGTTNVCGIYAAADVSNTQKRFVNLTSTANTVSATATNGNDVYALRLIAAKSDYTGNALFYGQEYACASNATIHGGTYTAKATGTTVRAVAADVRAITPTGADIAYPELIINGGTFSAEAGTSSAYALSAGGNTTVDGGIFTAITGTTDARGFNVTAGKLAATNARLDVTAGTGTARGIHLGRGRNEYSADSYDTEVELNTLTVNAKTTTGNNAYGISADGNQNYTWTDGTFQTYCIKTLKCLNADGSVIDGKEEWYEKYNRGYQRGEFVALPKSVTVNGGTYTVVANGTIAYGISLPVTGVSATGKDSAAISLTMQNAAVSVTTETGATAYGVYTSGPTTIDNCDILATSATTGARGIHIYDNKTVLTNSTVSVNAAGNDVYGVYAYAQVTPAGWQYKAELESDNTVINAETVTGSGVYAIWLHAHAAQATTDTYGRLGNDYAVAASAVLNGGTCKIVAQGDVIKDGNGTITGPVVYGLGFQAEAVKNDASAAPSCIVNGGKYWGESKAENKFADVQSTALRGKLLINDGYFRNSTNVTPYIREGYSLFDLPTTTKEYEEGYRYFIAPASASGTYVCEVVGQQQYKTLEEALQFVNLNPNTAYTIRMLANYTLPAGDYVLPAKATLLIPYKADQEMAVGKSPTRANENGMTPYAYITLSFASGVNMTVFGTIEAGAEQWTTHPSYGGLYGPYGHLHLKDNVIIDLEYGAQLMAWGYVTGKGLINAKKGASLYEMFQLGDWKGGGVTTWMACGGLTNVLFNNITPNEQKIFPLTHYFYQNIEASVLYRPGSQSTGVMGVVIDDNIVSYDNIKIMGPLDSGALFLMDAEATSEDTYIRKDYNPLTDRTTWILNNNATLGAITTTITFMKKTINIKSSDYVLPLSSNMNIVVQSGVVDMKQDTYIMPGTRFEINKDATFIVSTGKKFYVVDKDQWVKGYGNGNSYYIYTPYYSPNWQNNIKSPRDYMKSDNISLPDAEIFVHGAIEVEGNLYTTDGGANIHSTNEDAGKVSFKTVAPSSTNDKFYQCNSDCGGSSGSYYWNYETYSLTSAKLKNGNDTYTQTASTNAGESFIYVNDQWIKTVDNGCMSTVTDGAGEHLYIHAGDMVEVQENGDHAYKDKATGTRYFINTNAAKGQANCVWWEVEPKDGGYYMANQEKYDNYGTYYYYDSASDFWKPKTVTVTWKNYDGTTLAVYSDVSYNTSPKYLGATPTRQNTAIAKYAWTGWTDAEGKFYEKNIALPVALADMTYTAWFTENKYQYTVTFKNHDGSLIESGLWEVGEMPVCSVTPQRTPTESEVFTFSGTWQPQLEAVTGPAEYTAQYTAATRYYTVTFVNYDGTVLSQEEFLYGTMPAYRGTTPVRESNTAYSYTFSGWDKPFEAVKGNITYTAQFTAKEREYGEVLDIVDWIEQGPVLNMNGYISPSAMAGWTISAEGIDYTKDHRAADRTLQIALPQTYAADDEVLILAKGTDGVVESRRRYKVPHVFNADAVLGAVAADYSSVLFVRAGKLTVMGDATVAAVYVAPGAELCINAGVTLAAGKLVLRTEAFASAVFTNNGTLLCDNVCYSRIVSDKSQAYPLALPFDADLSKVTFSNGKTASFGTHFGLLAFDTQQRADRGDLNGGNWVGVNPAETTKLNACQGYQLLSASGYWSEYRFPVTYTPDGADAALPVKVAEGTAHKGHWGWNAFCSPYTSRFVCLPVSPEEAVKICLPNTDNRTYRQEVAATLEPASLFFHQAVADGTLSFGADAFAFVTAQPSVVARQMPAVVGSEQTQWIRLFCGNNAGMQDETTVYLHPDKFSMDYQTGYDVIKLSKQGTLPFVWSALPYGDMAFAALPDSVAERGIALAVFAPTADEMYFSLEENDWLMRLEHLWLLDKEEQMQTDLLENDYSWLASAGVSRGRFFLYPVLRNAPDNNTGWNELHTDDFVVYSMGKTIVVEHLTTGRVLRCYDTTGQLISCLTTDAEQLSIEVPTDGMYFVQVDNGVKKVMVK